MQKVQHIVYECTYLFTFFYFFKSSLKLIIRKDEMSLIKGTQLACINLYTPIYMIIFILIADCS